MVNLGFHCMLTFSLGWTFKSIQGATASRGNTEPGKTESTTTEDANKVIIAVLHVKSLHDRPQNTLFSIQLNPH